MRRTIRFIGYAVAFVLVMPQIITAFNAGNMSLTYVLCAAFIAVVEGIVAVLCLFVKGETLNELDITLPEKDIRELMKM